jgi:hypothetical protein
MKVPKTTVIIFLCCIGLFGAVLNGILFSAGYLSDAYSVTTTDGRRILIFERNLLDYVTAYAYVPALIYLLSVEKRAGLALLYCALVILAPCELLSYAYEPSSYYNVARVLFVLVTLYAIFQTVLLFVRKNRMKKGSEKGAANGFAH